MECVEDNLGANFDPKEKDAAYWWNVLNTVGSVPFNVLFKDRDRMAMCLYAAGAVIMLDDKEAETKALKEIPVSNPEFDPYKENVEQDGKHWGIRMERPNLPKTNLSLEERQSAKEAEKAERQQLLEASKISNIRSQVEAKQQSDLETFKSEGQPDMEKLDPIREAAPDVYQQKWAIAERLAHKPREAWQNAPFELRRMTEWCYSWLRDTGTIPENKPDTLVDILWSRPRPNLSPEANARRNFIVDKIRNFWVKSVEGHKDKVNLTSESYRVTLSAMELDDLIEKYANGEQNEDQIKKSALKYFNAHFDIELLGVKPGPITTLDPDYVGYLKLCQKYNLTPGVLLHEADL